MVSRSQRRLSIFSANAVAAGGFPSSTAMYRTMRSRSASASGETMTSYMVFLPNGGEGCPGVFPESCGDLPFGSCDLLVKGEFGQRFVKECRTDDDGRPVAVFRQIDRSFFDFGFDFRVFVSKI